MHKAVVQIGNYVVIEGPTGGWRVFPGTYEKHADQPISIHGDKAEAVAAAKRYQAGDKRRAA